MGAAHLLLEPGLAPFTLALALVAGLLLLELVFTMMGASLMGAGADAGPDLDAGPDFDPDLDAGLDAGQGLDAGPGADGASSSGGGIAAWLGFGKVPAVLWLAGLLTAFGVSGYLLQLLLVSSTGVLLPAWGAAVLALVPGLAAGRWFARTLGRLLPGTESTAIARRSLGDRIGVVVQGTARRGLPAQARVRDGHGNLHHVRIEPVDDDAEIPPGTEVIILRGRGPVLKAIPVGAQGEDTQ